MEDRHFKLMFVVDTIEKRRKLNEILKEILDKDMIERVYYESNGYSEFRLKNNVMFKVIGKEIASIRGHKFTAYVNLCDTFDYELEMYLRAMMSVPQYKL